MTNEMYGQSQELGLGIAKSKKELQNEQTKSLEKVHLVVQ